MWRKLLWLLLPLFVVLLWAEYTWQQSTNSGPFAYFRSKYPDLAEQQLLQQANSDINDFAKSQKDISNITKYMETIGGGLKIEVQHALI